MAEFLLPARTTAPGSRRAAPRGPSAADVPSVGLASDPGVRVPENAFGGADLGNLGAGLQKLSENVFKAAEKQQELFDFAKTNDAFDTFQRETTEEFHRRQIEDDPARPDFMDDFGRFLDAKASAAIANLPEGISEEARLRLSVKLKSQGTAYRDSAGLVSLKAQQEQANDAFDKRLNTLSAQAQQYPELLDNIVGEADATVSELSRNMTPDQERNAKQKGREFLTLAAVNGYIDAKKFDKARLVMADDERAAIFDPKVRLALDTRIAKAEEDEERRLVKAEEDAEKKADKAAKKLSDDIRKEGITLASDDRLTTDWVIARKDALDVADYAALMKAADKEDGEDNPLIVSALYERMADNLDVERDAIEAFNSGDLKRETMNTILSRNDSRQSKLGSKTSFQRASAYLVNALKPSELNDNPDASLAYANAEADLMAFFDENPQASTKQAMDYAKELASSYRLVPGTVLSLPFPTWMVGDRAAKQPDLDQTEAKLAEDMGNGTITREEAKRRAAVVNRWRDYLDQGMN